MSDEDTKCQQMIEILQRSIGRKGADVAVLSPSMFMKFSMNLNQFRGRIQTA